MATDHEGNSLSVGDVVYVPAKITAVNSTSLSLETPEEWGAVATFTVPPNKTHRTTKPPWPDVP